MKKLDRSKDFAEHRAETGVTGYEQDGCLFDPAGNEIVTAAKAPPAKDEKKVQQPPPADTAAKAADPLLLGTGV